MNKTIFILIASLTLASATAHAGFGDFIKKIPGAEDLTKNLPIPGNTQKSPEPEPKPQKQSSTSSPLDQLAKKDISKATTIGNYTGLITGGVAGHLLCKKSPTLCKSKATQALVVTAMAKLGSDIGSKIGKQLGETTAARRRQYAAESDYLDSEIKASSKAISVRKKGIKSTDKKIASTRKRIDYLNNRQSLTAADIAEAKKLKEQTKETYDTNKNVLVQFNEKIAYLDHALKTSEEKATKTNENKNTWKKKHASLKSKRSALVNQRDNVKTQNTQLASDQKILDKMLS